MSDYDRHEDRIKGSERDGRQVDVTITRRGGGAWDVKVVVRASSGVELANRRGGHLEPAARPAAEVDHPLAGSPQPVSALDLVELVGRARTESLALGSLVEAILAVVRGRQPG